MNKKTIIGIMIVISLVATILLGSEYIKKEDTKPEYLKNLELISSEDSYSSGIPVKKKIFHDEHGNDVITKETHDGEIIFYTSVSKYNKQGTKNITKEEALRIVKEELEVPEDYVLNITENKNNRYRFWFNRVVEGISLRSDRITALVNKGTGEISMWSKTYHEELPDLTPTISREEALKIANEEFNGGAEIKELTVETCWVNQSAPPSITAPTKLCLAWLIIDTDSEYYRSMFLDAHTGERI
ncbi:MAG: hypothetical protein KAU95_03455 [Candidatus Aenigmarchaeota archaeon]|nr:hypothetical protein [Candidatus Aenigmarchaeota archaeon]